jgi:serine/threonine-protein kinase HipA
LLNLSLSTPLLDYSNLLALTGYLTHNEADVEQMFRRMVFNYLTDNKDDHCKNFSFIITQDEVKRYSWHLAPAYDLTWCAEGYNGEHATSVNGTGNPTLEDMVSVGVHINMPEHRCQDLYQEVKSACAAGGLLHHEIKE